MGRPQFTLRRLLLSMACFGVALLRLKQGWEADDARLTLDVCLVGAALGIPLGRPILGAFIPLAIGMIVGVLFIFSVLFLGVPFSRH